MGRERGQTSVEYLGVLVVVVAIVLALLAGSQVIGGKVVQRLGCLVTLTDCPGPGGGSGPSAQMPPADPHLTPAERALLTGDPAKAQDVLRGLSPAERAWLAQNDPEAARGADAAATWAQRRDELRYYRNVPLKDFIAEKESPDHDKRMNWTDDGCSAPLVGSTGLSFDFTAACKRHDFGYRNSKELGLFGQDKDAIDSRFLQDMKDHCATRSIFLQSRCYSWAYTFYAGVRAFG